MNKNDVALSSYLRELGQIRLLTSEEEIDLAPQNSKRRCGCARTLASQFQPVAIWIAHLQNFTSQLDFMAERCRAGFQFR